MEDDAEWVKGRIYSQKFGTFVISRVNPNEFIDAEEESETLKELKETIKEDKGDISTFPLSRLEPNTVMLHFIKYLAEKGQLDSEWGNYYLGIDENDGDNSDNGHFHIEL